jgi:hypothetical protein
MPSFVVPSQLQGQPTILNSYPLSHLQLTNGIDQAQIQTRTFSFAATMPFDADAQLKAICKNNRFSNLINKETKQMMSRRDILEDALKKATPVIIFG